MSTEAERATRLANAQGTFTMVAVDQRGSLRAMLQKDVNDDVSDTRLRDFKVAVSRALSPHASAILVDVDYGLDPILAAGALDKACTLIAAVDRIDYSAEGKAEATSLRRELVERDWDERVAGFKFLLIWSPDGWLGCTPSEIEAFVEGAAAAGVDSVLEVLVRDRGGEAPASPGRQAELLVEAAREMDHYGATLYKTEVPFYGRADQASIAEVSRQLTDILSCPWVVLSSGVVATDFPGAVAATHAGGAAGFLAGRAIWGSAATAPDADLAESLENQSVPALLALIDALGASTHDA
jgi:sulfofructosephosphate aldolase